MTFPCRSRLILYCLPNYCSLVINWRVSLFIAGGLFMYCQENGISLCPVIKVRSEELQDNIQTLSKTLCRIRDKSQKSLISTDLRFWDRFQGIYVPVNSSGHNKCIQACFVQSVVYLAAGRVGFDEHEEQRARYVHTNLSELSLTKSCSESQHAL